MSWVKKLVRDLTLMLVIAGILLSIAVPVFAMPFPPRAARRTPGDTVRTVGWGALVVWTAKNFAEDMYKAYVLQPVENAVKHYVVEPVVHKVKEWMQ